jgi:uncharacterized membrane protein
MKLSTKIYLIAGTALAVIALIYQLYITFTGG